MIYVMSDIHGCYNEFIKMMDLIQLKDNDTLYILGDVIDRGNGSLQILDYIMNHQNIKMILGNHEDLFLNWYKAKIKLFPYIRWLFSTFNMTFLKQFKALSTVDKEKYFNFLQSLALYKIIIVNDKKYLLIHAGINYNKAIEKQERKIMLCGSEYWIRHKNTSNYIIVFGHKTIRDIFELMVTKKDNIWEFKETNRISYFFEITNKRKTNHIIPDIQIFSSDNKIAIDCGCVFGDKLGCIRLDDMKEFYVERK